MSSSEASRTKTWWQRCLLANRVRIDENK